MSLSNSHGDIDLVYYLKECGYTVNEKGACYGVSVMALQAILANDLEAFNRRIKTIGSIPSVEFKQAIDTAEKKRMQLIRHYKIWLLEKCGIKKILDEKEFNTWLQEEKNKDNQYIKAYFTKLNKIDHDLQLDQRTRDLLDTKAFFDGIALYAKPALYPDLFEEKERPKTQDLERTFPVGLPLHLIERKEIKSSEKEGKSEITTEGQVTKITDFSGIYRQTDLEKYFKSFQNQEPGIDNPPAVFLLSSTNHAITVSYNPSRKIWTLINANRFRLPKPIQEFKDYKDIANAVLTSFSTNELATFSTEIFCTKSQKKMADQWFEECTNNREWKEIHNVKNKVALQDSFGGSWLSVAARKGYLNEAKALLTQKANPNNTTANGETPLFIAAQNGHSDMVDLLLHHPTIEINKTLYTDRATALFVAAQNNYAQIVDLLLHQNNIDPNKERTDKTTPLYMAAAQGHMEVVTKLLAHPKTDPNKANNNGETPLYMATAQGHMAVVTKLLVHPKTDPNKANNNGETPLSIAIEADHIEVAEIFLAHPKIDINKANKDGETPIRIAFSKGHIGMVEKLLNHPKIKLMQDDKDMIFFYSIKQNYSLMVKKLIEKKVDIQRHFITKTQILLNEAAKNNRKNQLQLLFQKKSIISAEIKDLNALHFAVLNGNMEIVCTLINAGINIHEGRIAAIDLADAMGYSDIVGLLLRQEFKSEMKNEEEIKALSKMKTLLNVTRDEKNMAQVYAEYECFKGLYELIKQQQPLKDPVRDFCADAYKNYAKAETIDERIRVRIQLAENIEKLKNDTSQNKPRFFP